MIELTAEQRQQLGESEPVLIDPQTRKTYVLIPQETFERFKRLLSPDEYDPTEGMVLLNEVLAEDDAKDPLLQSYQHYGKST